MLSLFDTLYFLALDQEKGSLVSSVEEGLGYGLAGGILAELALAGKVKINEDRRLEVIDSSSCNDEILDTTLQQIKDAKRPRKATYWIRLLNDRPKKLRKQAEKRLIASGVLVEDEEEEKYSLSTPASGGEQGEALSKYELKNRLRSVVLAEQAAGLTDLALLSLARASGLLALIFTKDELRTAQRGIHKKTLGQAISNPVVESLEEICEAVATVLSDDSD